MKRIYMYTLYSRIWHWLQALLIALLLLTGVELHWPAFALFGFATACELHELLAFVLIANAFLALVYYLATGEVRQLIPEPRELFSLMAKQTRYYLHGIFRGEHHPLNRHPERRLNPLQQVAYLLLLNVLLPLQVLTGLLMWGASRWPHLLDAVGGLQVVAGLHTLGSFFLGAFLVVHVYLATTGHTPLALIRGMITGWEEAEHPEQAQPEAQS